MFNRVALSAAAVFVLLSGTARMAAASDVVEAEELIRQANEHRRHGEDQKALPLLKQAYETARSPRTAAQFGLAELALGYWVEAEGHLDEALMGVTRHPFVDKNREALETSRRAAHGHVAEVRVDGLPAGAEVLVNGRTAGTLPLPRPLRVNEGRLEVQVRSTAHQPVTRVLNLAGGSAVHLTFDLSSGNSGATSPTAAITDTATVDGSAAPTPWTRLLPAVLAGTALAAAIVGVWQHVAWRGTQSDFNGITACGQDAPLRGTDPRCRDLYDQLDGERTRAFVGYGVAATLSMGAGVAFLLNRSATSGQEAVTPGPGTLGLSYRVRF